MRIVLLTKLGGMRTLQMAPWKLFVALGLAVAVIAVTAIQLHQRHSHHRQVAQALAEWRAGVIEQQAAVTQLQQEHAAESAAISKQLANMQGRLWRMEALGQWVTEATGLDAEDFDFAAPPAQGGPLGEAAADCAQAENPWQRSTVSGSPIEGRTPSLRDVPPTGKAFHASEASMRTERTEGARSRLPASKHPEAPSPPARCRNTVPPRPDLHMLIVELAGQIRQRQDEFELFEALLKAPPVGGGQETKVRPVKWGWVSSPYGQRIDPISGKMAWHAGVDFAGRMGSDVIAADRGIVAFAGYRAGYGNLVELTHLDGHVTRYGHQAKLAVRRGDIVRQGQVLGSMGTTGRSTGPHVHFEVLKNGRHRNPMTYLKDQRG